MEELVPDTPRAADRDAAPAEAPAAPSIVNELISTEAVYSIDRMAEVLRVGPDSERDFVLFELNALLENCPEETLKTLVPVLCAGVPAWSLNLQFRVGEGLNHVVNLVLLPETAWTIVASAFAVVAGAPDHFSGPSSDRESFYDLWGAVILDALAQVDWTDGNSSIEHVLTAIDGCSDRPDIPEQRKLAAKLLAPLGGQVAPEAVTRLLLPRALKLTSDFDVLVRGTVAGSLAEIGQSLSLRTVENEVWPRLVVLLEDVDSRIRAATLRTIGRILSAQRERQHLEPESTRLFKELLPPVFVRWSTFAKKASSQDQRLVDDDTYLLLEVVAEVFGELLYSTSLCKENVFRKHAIKAFVGMATCNGPLIRRNCAFNTPGVALTLQEKYAAELCTVVECLARDTDEEVRWILAAGFHETLRILSPLGRQEKLLTSFGTLVHDPHRTVRQHILEHFADSVTVLAKDGDLNSVRKLTPILQNVGDVVNFPWRSQEQFALEVDTVAHLLPPNLLIEKILPAIFEMVQQGNRLVKRAGINAIVRSLRFIPDVFARDTAITNFWGKCLEGNYAMRLAFLEGARKALVVFSQALFRQLFAPRVLLCIRDKVVNIRYSLAQLMPLMAVSCSRLPYFGTALQVLRRDPDQTVRVEMRRFQQVAGKLMATSAGAVDEDVYKARSEANFFGQQRRVNAMKPSLVTVVRGKVSNKRSKDEPSEGSGAVTDSGDRENEVAPSGRLDVAGALAQTKSRNAANQPVRGSLDKRKEISRRSESFTFGSEYGSFHGSSSELDKQTRPIASHRRSKSLKDLLSSATRSVDADSVGTPRAGRFSRRSLERRGDAHRVAKQLPNNSGSQQADIRKSGRATTSPRPPSDAEPRPPNNIRRMFRRFVRSST